MADRVIDFHTHFMPPGYLDELRTLSRDPGLLKRFGAVPILHDLEARRRLVGQWGLSGNARAKALCGNACVLLGIA